MIIIRRYIWLFLSIIIVDSSYLSACQEKKIILPIKLSLLEGYGDLNKNYKEIEPSYFLVMVSEKIYNQYNYEILYKAELLKDTIKIYIHGVKLPSVGLDAFGPATAKYKLPIEEGKYLLFIINGDTKETYNLVLDEEKLTLVPIIETEQPELLLWRFPQNSFAFICYAEDDICDSFNKIINENLQLEEIFIKQYGSWPLRDNPPTMIFNDTYFHFYRYKSIADYNKVGELLDDFMKKQEKHLKIYLMNWQNKVFSSKPLSYYK